jgi:hypothetical protein
VLVHAEVQGAAQTRFAKRRFQHNYRISLLEERHQLGLSRDELLA